MDSILQLATTGAQEIMLAQTVNANNLANASTTGFRADLMSFSPLGLDSKGPESRIDLSHGVLQTTNRSLDVAINGDGWIAVRAPDGEEVYSRRGDLHIDSLGQLTNGAGLPVLGNSGPIAIPPFSELEIGSDGTISIQPVGQSPATLAVVDRIKLVQLTQSMLFKGEDGLLRLPKAETAVPSSEIRLISGALEGSNVNTIESMVRMIELARNFELQIKMMQDVEENANSMAQVMRIA